MSLILLLQKTFSITLVIPRSRYTCTEYKKNQTYCTLFLFIWFSLQPTLKSRDNQERNEITYKENTSEVLCMHRYLGRSLMPDLTNTLCRENVVMARGSLVKKDIVGSLS